MASGYEIGHKEIDQWIGGVSYEVAFWNGYLKQKENREAVLKKVSSVHDIEQPLGIAEDILVSPGFKLLDVGCGMAYHNAPYIDGHKVELHYVDPLAFFYNRIAKSQGLKLPEIEFGMVEYLSGFYPADSISCVLIQNALDHCFQPVRGIIESLKVLKTGGTLYLFHHKNEAEHENYAGFHQFNIDFREKELVIWNKTEHYNLNELLKDCAHIEAEEINDHVRARIIKENGSLPVTQSDDVKVLSEQVMYLISKLMDPTFTAKYQRTFRRERNMHLLAQLVSPELKEKVKKLKKNQDGAEKC